MSARGIEAARAFVRVLWEDSAIKRGIERTQALLRSTAASIGKVGAGLAGAGAAILAPLSAAIFQFSAAGDELDKMSGRTGASAEALSQLKYAASQSGTSLDAVEKALKKINKTTTDAGDGLKSASDSLSAVGLSAQDLKGQTPEKQLQIVAEALQGISDPGERAARAMDIMGKSGTDLLPLMNNGAKGIENLMNQADALGLTVSQDQATAAAQFGDAWDDVKSTLGGVSMQIAAAVVPALTDLLKQVAPIIGQVVAWVRENAGIVRGVALLGVGLVVAGTALTVFAGLLSTVAFVIGAIFSPLGLVIGLVAALGVGIVQMAGGADAALQMLKDAFPGLGESVSEVFGALKNLLNSGEYSAAANLLWLGLKLAWITGIDAINQEWMLWKKAFLDTFDSALQYVEKKWAGMQNTLAKGTLHVMAFFDKSINVDDALSTLDEDFQRRAQESENKFKQKQASRDAEFESNIGKVNRELEDARAAWSQALDEANQITDAAATDPTAADVADDKFTKLVESLRAGDIATRINDTVKASSDKAAGDVRSVSGAGQLEKLINRQQDVDRRTLSILQTIAANTSKASTQVVRI